MSLAAGARLGPYAITAPIGVGGMGEVYKATDTRLDRTVAIKVLPVELASDPERRGRFEREAKAIAALNHPNICTLHEFDSHEDTDFLVMEHLEGESLQDRLERGALPLDQALEIGVQIADALDHAHGHGITHRDLKPGNVFLTRSGAARHGWPQAKLLDFGLAKLSEPVRRDGLQPGDQSTTLGGSLTAQGTILGTFHYMAPELLDGQTADHVSDIWSFGCVLYEMLTGRKLFDGESVVAVAASVARQELTWHHVPDWMPPEIRRVLQRTVHRDRRRRLRDIADVRLELLDTCEASTEPWRGAPGDAASRSIVTKAWQLTTAVCRRLSRHDLDPAIIGDHVEYLDNERTSDRLVVYLPPVGMDHATYGEVLERSPYRGIAFTPYGMEPHRRRRIPLRITDHLAIVRLFLESVAHDIHPRQIIVAGFSSGADMAFRLVADASATGRQLSGVLALSPNLDRSTCFYTAELARIPADAPHDVFRVVKDVMGRIDTADAWLRLAPYWSSIVRKYRGDVDAVRQLALDTIAPFEAGTTYPIAEWYRAAKRHGLTIRVVFAGDEAEQRPLRGLLLAHVERQVLGAGFVDGDVVTEPDTDHFDLLDAAIIERHLADIFEAARALSEPEARDGG